jgi:hypothetical protein
MNELTWCLTMLACDGEEEKNETRKPEISNDWNCSDHHWTFIFIDRISS